MYIHRKRNKKVSTKRCVRKHAKLKAKNRNRIARVSRASR